MALDVVLARVVKENGAVAELVLVGAHAEHVGGEHEGRLTLVSVKLVDSFAPVVAARDVALVFRDHQRDPVYE